MTDPLPYSPIEWTGASLRFLDQTRLPGETVTVETGDYRRVIDAIRRLEIRGAPLLGIAAAYAVVLAARGHAVLDGRAFHREMGHAFTEIAGSRPTAVNLFWALDAMRRVLSTRDPESVPLEALEAEARRLHEDDRARCERIGMNGTALLPDRAVVITHCNTGALATGGIGTAFGILLTAHRMGKRIHVYVDETRPLLQGARLTMWELARHGIPATLMTDGTAAFLMARARIDAVITGADRIAANGDTANKIGTYGLAIAARHHDVPFYIAAPFSTVDPAVPTGGEIPIEERNGDDVAHLAGIRIAPEGSAVYAPAFDVTPHELIRGIVTERGIITPPYSETLRNAGAYLGS